MAKTETVRVRLSQLEKQAVGEFAEDCNLSVNALIEKVLREVIGAGPHLLSDDLKVLDEATQQLAAIGRNLNQIVRAMNSSQGRNITIDSGYLATIKGHVDQVAIAVAGMIDQQKARWAPVRKAVVSDGE